MLVISDVVYNVILQGGSTAVPSPSATTDEGGDARNVQVVSVSFLVGVPVVSVCILISIWIYFQKRGIRRRATEQGVIGGEAAPTDEVGYPYWIPAMRNRNGEIEAPPGYWTLDMGNGQSVFIRDGVGYPEIPGRVGGIKRFDANRLKSFEVGKSNLACGICLEELQSEGVSAGECVHVMHTRCLKGWLVKDKERGCPVCREVVEGSASREQVMTVVAEDGVEVERTEERRREIENRKGKRER